MIDLGLRLSQAGGEVNHAVDLHSLRAGSLASLARDDHVLCIRRQIPGS